jgi:L-lactate dehydrogenase complex protein LldG
VPEFPQFDDPATRFKKQAEAVGTVVLDGQTEEGLSTSLARVVKEAESEHIFWEREAVLQKHGVPYEIVVGGTERDKPFVLASAHPQSKCSFPLQVRILPIEEVAPQEIAVSAVSAEKGIAETGTIVENSAPGGSRILSVLPPVHVVLLSTADLLMNPLEFFEIVELGKLESSRLLMTGPSRTADIERTLVIGVHGPKKLFVILTAGG